jgi:hypothetical protein
MKSPYTGIYFAFSGVIQNGEIDNALHAGVECYNGSGLISAVIFKGVQTAVAGILVSFTVGIFISHCQIFTCGTGIYLAAHAAPPGSQTATIDNVIIDNTFIDTLAGSGILLESTTSAAKLTHTAISQTWMASCANYGFVTTTSGGGIIDCVSLVACKVVNSGYHGVEIQTGTTNLQIRDCLIYYNGYKTPSHGINLEAGVSQFSIQGCKIGSTVTYSGNTGWGIQFSGANTNCIITGNNLQGNVSGEQNGVPTGTFVNTNNI